jgi:hypothetical protein
VIARRLLYLDTHRLSAHVWRHGKLQPEGLFDNSEEGLARFAEYLAAHRHSHYSLLANVAEEGHVLETIPFLRGSDRQALITRKIGQHFLGTPLAAAFSLGYEKGRRKNEKLLISALTNTAHFEPWLQRINAAGAPLAGVYTVAQLGGLLLKKLGLANARCLLLTWQDHSIRESYLVNGQTIFSRMAPITDSSIAGVASRFTAEAAKLHQYLIGQRLIGRDETLPVFIVAYPPAIPAIENACPDHGHLAFSIIDSHVAASKLGLHTPPEDSSSDFLYLHLLTTAPPRQQFADETYRHDFRLSQIRHGIVAAGLIALFGSLLFSAKQSHDAHALRQEVHILKAGERDLDLRYQEISATFPQLGVDNDTLRRVTTRHAELSRQQHQPGTAYLAVSHALDRMPDVILEGIDWKIGRQGTSTAAGIEGSEEITTVRGTIGHAPGASTRQILASFEQFADLLRKDQAFVVNVLQRPFDMESGRPLRGGSSEDESGQPRQFTVEMIRKIAP